MWGAMDTMDIIYHPPHRVIGQPYDTYSLPVSQYLSIFIPIRHKPCNKMATMSWSLSNAW